MVLIKKLLNSGSMNKTWLIKENIVKVLGNSDISRTKLDETTWVDNDGNLMIPNVLLKPKSRRIDVDDVFLHPERLKYRQELSSEMENLLGKPILFSKESNIVGIGILTGFSTKLAEVDGIQLRFKYTEITVRNGKLFHFSHSHSVSTEHWTEIRELSTEEFEEIKIKLLNYYNKPFRVKYEID